MADGDIFWSDVDVLNQQPQHPPPFFGGGGAAAQPGEEALQVGGESQLKKWLRSTT